MIIYHKTINILDESKIWILGSKWINIKCGFLDPESTCLYLINCFFYYILNASSTIIAPYSCNWYLSISRFTNLILPTNHFFSIYHHINGRNFRTIYFIWSFVYSLGAENYTQIYKNQIIRLSELTYFTAQTFDLIKTCSIFRVRFSRFESIDKNDIEFSILRWENTYCLS